MLGAAVGCIGMRHEEFCGLYFEEFESIFKAWREMNDAQERDAWERTRILGTICIQPHVRKRITPRQLMPLPWDSHHRQGAKAAQLTKERQKARFEELAKRSRQSPPSDPASYHVPSDHPS